MADAVNKQTNTFLAIKTHLNTNSPIVGLTDHLCFYTDTRLVLKFGIKVFFAYD